MMHHTQFLCFEIGPVCNLAKEHVKCPSADPRRWENVDTTRPITDNLIVGCIYQAYRNLGFRGHVAWHHYNEPMLAWDRLKPLMARIKTDVPEARFTLWTNETQLPVDVSELKVFDQVWISDYARWEPSAPLGEIMEKREWLRHYVKDLHILSGVLDHRLNLPVREGDDGCARMFNELTVDHYGNGRLCCMDWQATSSLGNVWDEGFRSIVDFYLEIRGKVAKIRMDEDAPAICKRCGYRSLRVDHLVPEVAREIEDHLARHHIRGEN